MIMATHERQRISMLTEPMQQGDGERLHQLRARMAEEQLDQGAYEALAAAITQMQTPFNMLNAALEMLQRRVAQQHRDEQLLTILMAVREQGLTTLESLRQSLPQRQLATPVSVNLNKLIHEVLLTLTERLLATGIVIDWQPQKVLPALIGWESRLRCLLMQLLDNAIVAITVQGDDMRSIHIESMQQDDWLKLVIHDSGPGIPAGERLMVFEPFHSRWPQTPRHHSGMGLSMVQETINLHGANLIIDPDADGCRIEMHFPLFNGNAV